MEVQARGGQVQQVPDEPWCNAAWGQHHRTGCLDHHRAHKAVRLQVRVWVWKTAAKKKKPKVRTQETRPAYRPSHSSVPPPPHPESWKDLPNHLMSQERPYPGYNTHSWTDILDADPLPIFWDSLELHSSLFSTKSWMTGDNWTSKGDRAGTGLAAHLSRGPATAAEGAVLGSSVVWISPSAVGPRPVSLAEEKVRAIRLRALTFSHTCRTGCRTPSGKKDGAPLQKQGIGSATH